MIQLFNMQRKRLTKVKIWIKESDYLDAQYLKEFESYLLNKYSLLKSLPFFKSFRLGRAIEKWNERE